MGNSGRPKVHRIVHIQPALPGFRLDFFDRLSRVYGSALVVLYSPSSLGALTGPVNRAWAVPVGSIRQLPCGLNWQSGIAGIPLRSSDIVVLSGNPRQLSTLLLLFRARVKGCRIVWWGHYWSSTSRRWRQILRYIPMMLAHAMLFYTDHEVEAFFQDQYTPRGKRLVAALNNGLYFEPILRNRLTFHASERERALLFIGRLTEKANLGIALKALSMLGVRSPVLHVIGNGEMREALISQACDFKIDKQVIWHGALTDEAAIAQIANRCQSFVYPGQVGLSLIHAMAYTLPAIVHNDRNRHMPEIAAFREDGTGLSFKPDDARSLARTIEEMLSDCARMERFSAEASAIVGRTYTTENMAHRFVALITKLSNYS